MGRSIQAKIDKRIAQDEGFMRCLDASNSRMKAKANDEAARVEAAVRGLIEPHLGKAWRGLDTFKSKTRSSRIDKRALEAARHLFGKHPVPPILWQAWSFPAEGSRAGIDPRAWFVEVGLGHSFLKTCAKGMLTRKEAHLFLACPHDGLQIDQALHWCVARSAGASDGLALRVSRSKIAAQPFDDFWRQASRFFAENAPASPQQASDLCDYLSWRRAEEPGFTVFGNGFTIASLLARMEDWHRNLARSKALGNARWAGSALADWEGKIVGADGVEIHWSATQILDAKALGSEGNAMRHCVLSYKRHCIDGRCSIWSLRRGFAPGADDQERKLTIELDSSGSISQARGLANRLPRPDEAKALRLWSRQSGIDLGSAI